MTPPADYLLCECCGLNLAEIGCRCGKWVCDECWSYKDDCCTECSEGE